MSFFPTTVSDSKPQKASKNSSSHFGQMSKTAMEKLPQ